MSKEFTLSDVSEHATKKDAYMVVHGKVYDVSAFVDEHPGGEEVMLDVAGQDATDAFEDVGHSDEAREILEGLLVGNLKRGENDPPPKDYANEVRDRAAAAAKSASAGSGFGAGFYVLLLAGGLLAYGAYQYTQSQETK